MQTFLDVYRNLSSDTLHRLDEIYTSDIHFVDPAHEIMGLPRLRQYFAVLYRNIVPPEFHFSHHQRSGDNAYVQWVMTFSHPRLNGGEQITVPGVSYLRFSGAEKVAFHQDYFDLGAMLYEQIPVLGRIITHLKRRLGS